MPLLPFLSPSHVAEMSVVQNLCVEAHSVCGFTSSQSPLYLEGILPDFDAFWIQLEPLSWVDAETKRLGDCFNGMNLFCI